jgi:outer membrane protein, heavy metal efflux system
MEYGMQKKSCYLIVVTIAILSGCKSQDSSTELPQQRPLGRSHEPFLPPKDPSEYAKDRQQATAVTGVLTLEKAGAAAMLGNPRLQSVAWSIRAAEARHLQAGLRPNPELDVEMENIAGSGAFSGTGNAETTVAVGQVVETGAKRNKRIEVAKLDSQLAGWDFEAQRLAILTEVTGAFVDALAAQEGLQVLDQEVTLAQKIMQTVEQRVAAGKDTPLQATQARVNLTRTRMKQKRLQQELATLYRVLAATWGATRVQFTQVRGSLDHIAPPPQITALESLITLHPQVARWDTEIKQRQAKLTLEKANARPDPRVMGGYRRLGEADESAFVLGLSLPLPVHNRNQGQIMEAKVALVQARRQRDAALVQVRTDLDRAYTALHNAYNAATDLQQVVLPGAQEAFDMAQTGYEMGKFNYLTVLDAQRTLFEVRSQYRTTLADFHKAKAQIEHLIGQSLPE